MAHVLIGFAEALPAAEVVFSLIAAGHRVSAFSRDTRLPLRHLPLAALHKIPAPESDAGAAADALRSVMQEGTNRRDCPEFFLPLDDAGLWLAGEACLYPDRVAGATGDQAELAMDKALQIEFARATGLSVPVTLRVRSGAYADSAKDLPVPAIAKPARAVSLSAGRLLKGGTVYLPDQRALRAFVDDRSKVDGPWLVQPLIAGRGEGVFGFATESGVTAWSGHVRLRMMNPHGSGASACTAQAVTPMLREQVAAFVERTNWRGPFMIEFLRDQRGTYWFMELNGRMWGSMALARRQGLEYPAWAVALATNKSFVPAVSAASEADVSVRHLGREILHLLFVMRGPKSEFHRAIWPRFPKSIADVLRPSPRTEFYNYDSAFPKYYLRDALWTVRRAVSR